MATNGNGVAVAAGNVSVGDSAAPSKLVTLDAVKEAHRRVQPHVHRTPLLTSSTLDRIASQRYSEQASSSSHAGPSSPPISIRLAFKAENLQVVGAFKIRGATNAVLTHLQRLQASSSSQSGHFDPSKLCVVTHSSGNHAAAVACAARSVGARAAVVMPRNAPQIKKSAVAGYGARIVECEPTQQAREKAAQALKDELESDGSGTIVRFIHPYDEELVIAGQGTMGVEIMEQAKELQEGGRRGCSYAKPNIRQPQQLEQSQPPTASARTDDKSWRTRDPTEPPIDIVVAPVGGGGMLSGVSTAIRSIDDRVIVIGAEPTEADDAARSLQTGVLQPPITPPRTICDGLLTALSPRTMIHIQRYVERIVTVGETAILSALRLVWERMKQIIEPSAAVGLAVVLEADKAFVDVVQRVADQRRTVTGVPDTEPVEVRIVVVWTGGNVELDAIVNALSQHSSRGNAT